MILMFIANNFNISLRTKGHGVKLINDRSPIRLPWSSGESPLLQIQRFRVRNEVHSAS
jgi:hypothetical protein